MPNATHSPGAWFSAFDINCERGADSQENSVTPGVGTKRAIRKGAKTG
jgi:hypothetical protein